MNLKRALVSLVATAMLTASFSASATSYAGYPRNWWVEENADITWYLLNQDNSVWVNGLCGSPVYRLKVTNANYDAVYDSLKMAARNGYRVQMEVVACDSNVNVIKMVKICTWIGDC